MPPKDERQGVFEMPGTALNVGRQLKKARRMRKIRIQQAAAELFIRKDFLKALEANRLDAFQSRAYAIGFLRTYAEFLGLDAEPLAARLKEQIPEEPFPVEALPADSQSGRAWLSVFGFILVTGLLSGAAWVGWQAVKQEVVDGNAATQFASLEPSLPATATQPAGRPAALLGNGTVSFFQALVRDAAPAGTVRMLAVDEARVAIRGKDGHVLKEGVIYPGESLELPLSLGIQVVTPDYGALAFFAKSGRVLTLGQPEQGLLRFALDDMTEKSAARRKPERR